MSRRRLGQHFLRDSSVARRIVDAANISLGDVVIEIGPGNGALTDLIVEQARFCGGSVILVELDVNYAEKLAIRYRDNRDVHVVCEDARDLVLKDLPGLSGMTRFRVIGNLPYYAGTPIVRSFLERDERPERVTVMLQREVARDMCANPGKMSLLSLAVQIYAHPKKLFDVPPSAFRPPPKVYSTVINLEPISEPLVASDEVDDIFKVARAAYLGRRKQLHNSLANGLGMSTYEVKGMTAAAGIDSERRPATLSIDEWIALAKHWRNSAQDDAE